MREPFKVSEGVGESRLALNLSESVNEFGIGPLDAVAVDDLSDLSITHQTERATLHRELNGTHDYLRPRTTNVALGSRTSSTLLEAGPRVDTVHAPVMGLRANEAESVE